LVYLAKLSQKHSKRAMRNALKRILVALGAVFEPEDFAWTKMGYGEIAAARAALVKSCQPAAINQSLSALRGVLHEAYRLGQISGEAYALAKDVDGIKAERLPAGRYIPEAQLKKIFSTCDRSDPTGIRDAAILAILISTGMRRAELCSLMFPMSIDLELGDITIIGKRNKQRLVNLGDALVDVQAWIEVRGRTPGPLFLGQGTNALTENSIYNILTQHAKRANVPALSPHDFRRTCASDLLDRVDVVTVQKILGHEDPKTTSRYDRRGDSAKRDAAKFRKIPREAVRIVEMNDDED